MSSAPAAVSRSLAGMLFGPAALGDFKSCLVFLAFQFHPISKDMHCIQSEATTRFYTDATTVEIGSQ